MSIDVDELFKEIITVSNEIIGKDIKSLRGFSERQVRAIAKQTQIIARGVFEGDIDDDLRDFFFDSLETMALNFVKTIKGIWLVTIEKVWNAVVNVLWDAINTATDIKLIVPASTRDI